jgi:hypothetical protein
LHVATRELFDDGPKLWVPLANDFVQMRRTNAGFLELVIRSAGIM